MLSGKMKQRPIRPVERQPMREWLLDRLNGREIPGLEWVNKDLKIFKIKWCHGSRHGWSLKDSVLFEKWAQHSGRHHDGDHKRWKANFRCALNSLKDVEEVKDMSISKGQNAFRVYRMLDCRRKIEKPRITRRTKSEPENKGFQKVDRCLRKDAFKQKTSGTTLSTGTCSVPVKQELSEEEEIMEDSESEGYQTDIQEDTSMDLTADERLSSASPIPEIKEEEPESSSCVNIPNFDKIIPGFNRIETEPNTSKSMKSFFEFGKNHLLPGHSSGFKVDLLKTQSPLTPVLQPFHLLAENITAKTGNPTFSLPNTTHAQFISPLICRGNSGVSHHTSATFTSTASHTASSASVKTTGINEVETFNHVTFPETPEGSETSHDSNCGEFIELTIYEEEITDTEVTSADDCIVLTNLSVDNGISTAMTSQPTHFKSFAGHEQYGLSQTVSSHSTFSYDPLTPP